MARLQPRLILQGRVIVAAGHITVARHAIALRRAAGATASACKRAGNNTLWARAMNQAIKHKRIARMHADAAYHELYGHPPPWRGQLAPGDTIKSAYSGRPGTVMKVYSDGSAAILWKDAPAPVSIAHERMPAKLLVKQP